eukprot:COSAG06_NODE_71332_length_185_cov_27.244186_1_plen_32_part_10
MIVLNLNGSKMPFFAELEQNANVVEALRPSYA